MSMPPMSRDGATGGAGVRLELTIVAGPHKGDVVAVHAEHLAMTAVEALGLPARLVVTNQRPEVMLET